MDRTLLPIDLLSLWEVEGFSLGVVAHRLLTLEQYRTRPRKLFSYSPRQQRRRWSPQTKACH